MLAGERVDVSTDYLDIRADYPAQGDTINISYRTTHRDGQGTSQSSAWDPLNPWLFQRF
jgi:hypothetical protein